MNLNKEKINQYFTPHFQDNKNTPHTIHLFNSLDSTNTWLKQNGACGDICLAEQQTAGKGRRGNQWLSPKAENIYLSLNWCFATMPAHLSLLSLVVGLSIVKALQQIGLSEHGVKWPNDIYWQGLKMGGILIESVTSAKQTTGLSVVIGIGLNINMPESLGEKIDQPWVSLSKILGKQIDRNQLLALLLEQLIVDLQDFEPFDVTQFEKQWQQWDVLQGQSVRVLRQHEELAGTVQGLDAQGRIGICLESGELQYFSSAEIRLKK
ncbi:MAG TPA: biotin--[acetyl-CoA-carboxylase] ligase [Leucothrix mucor]|uniref:biotin--[biotin carboxyl-carrier protein] ligase n=1 Tax=Leucothrix mucor TaxID=45248 RepID=A0A7V2T524_LEUMU|nr:biotin--[acetyl-CoA-carboxylase] ligase [Leucothrix mucor]